MHACMHACMHASECVYLNAFMFFYYRSCVILSTATFVLNIITTTSLKGTVEKINFHSEKVNLQIHMYM